MTPTIGIIGAGKVGTSLGLYFSHHGQPLSGFYSKTRAHAHEAAERCGANCYLILRDIVADSDLLFLTVPDDRIFDVWEEVKAFPLAGKVICHTSGLLSGAVFSGAEALGAKIGSMHMMCALGERFSWEKLKDTTFTVEGSAAPYLEQLLSACHNPVSKISTEKKSLYHAAGVFASNFMIALLDISQNLLTEAGISEKESLKMLEGLVRGNVDTALSKGTENALSGPLERGDAGTLREHLSVLSKEHQELYIKLSQVLLPIAKKKNPNRDYQTIREVILDETYR